MKRGQPTAVECCRTALLVRDLQRRLGGKQLTAHDLMAHLGLDQRRAYRWEEALRRAEG